MSAPSSFTAALRAAPRDRVYVVVAGSDANVRITKRDAAALGRALQREFAGGWWCVLDDGALFIDARDAQRRA